MDELNKKDGEYDKGASPLATLTMQNVGDQTLKDSTTVADPDGKINGVSISVSTFTDANTAAPTFEELTGANIGAIEYYEKGSDTKLDKAPTDAGTYTAKVTIGGATASVDYRIFKCFHSPVLISPKQNASFAFGETEQELITVEEGAIKKVDDTDTSTFEYALGTNADTIPTSGWSTDIPKGKGEGPFYVFYRVAGDKNHGNAMATEFPNKSGYANTTNPEHESNSYKPAFSVIVVSKTAPTPPVAKTLTYNSQDQELVEAGSATTGTMQYALGTDKTTAPTDNWDTAIPKGKEPAVYYVWYRVVNTNDTTSVINEPACVQVPLSKAEPTVTAPTATATYGQTLNDVSMTNPDGNPEGSWAWVDAKATSVGDVGTNSFKAKFTPTDADHYKAVEVDVSVTVNKANLTGVSVTQNGTLTYTGEAQTPEVTAAATAVNDQSVTFTYSKTQDGEYGDMPTVTNVADGGTFYYKASAPNHNDATGSFTVTVNKATPGDVTAPTIEAVNYDPNQTLANIELPEGWAWVTSTTVPTVGNSGYAAELTVDDANYDYTSVGDYNNTTNKVTRTVTLTVNKAEVTAPTLDSKTYNAQNQTATVPESTLYSVTTNNGGTGVGNYDVVLTLTDSTNFKWKDSAEAAKTLVFQITAASITDANVTLSNTSLVYSGSEQSVTVSSVKLGDTTLTADTDYEVTSGTTGTAKNTYTVTVTGRGNYKDTATAQWSIGLATPTIETIPTASAITYGQKLADSTLTNGAAKLGDTPVAGTFAWKNAETKPAVSDSNATEYDVVFTPTDADNYAAVECKVKLTVNKATPTVTAPTAKALTYTGSAQALVNAGSTNDGTMQYALGNATEATQSYTTSIPTAADAGTYYVWYKVVGDENHSDTTPASVTVTIQRRSSGGGSSTTTVTVPVTSDAAPGTVPVKASVSGTTATVTKLTDEQLAQVTTNKSGNKDADAETETNSVVIDVSGVAKDVKTATIPTETVKAVEETGSNLKVTLTDGSVEFDATAQAIITDEAKGTTIQVNLDAVKVTTLTSAQQSAVESLEVEVVLDAYVTSNGQRISDFKGGSATLSVPYTLKDGQAAQGIVVWYVASDGTRTQVDASYDGKNVVFTVPHFSNYVIAYDAAKAAACPQDTTCPISAFTDARTTAWYHDGVHWAIENSVMNGVGDGKFAPNGITTRAQVVTMLWRLEGSPAYVGMSEFSDVDNEQWYGPAIRWASAEGIVNGYDDGRFGANDAVTREQLVTILYRYAQYKKMDVSVGEDTNILSYDDAFDVSEWAIPAMQWACGSGIVNGIDKNGTLMLAPSDASTRAVVATMFWRFSK